LEMKVKATKLLLLDSLLQESISPPPSGGDEGEGEDSSRSGVQR